VTRFEVWAPDAATVEVALGDGTRRAMETWAGRAGWWWVEVPEAGPGTDYGYVVDGSDPLPDPRSRWQPSGVHGLSRVPEPEFPWTDQGWHGRPLAGSVLYELHVGTFSPEGTFDGALARLDHLVELGIDAVELMPVAAFAGAHGWGYDGVDLWAVHDPYGGPDGLRRFVDGCHARGLAVVLDVVYNHLGPSGNYLGRFGPYFTDAHKTPWGAAVNYDQPGSDEVRAFVLDNARMWLRDYHLDGLRLDAVHAIVDHRAVPLLEGLGAAADELRAELGREVFLVAESDLNDPQLVTSREAGGYGLDAQWNDDFHHALHVTLTGEAQGYYEDFGVAPLTGLAKTLTGAFFHDGTWSSFRGRSHGRPVDRVRTPGHRFLAYQQNHDQVGNRATGDRLSADALVLGAAIMLTSPFTPMLFMGEEWGATTPFQYFTDHQEPELAESIRQGRRREFAHHGWAASDVPDPQAVDTFLRSKLDWAEAENSPALAAYRALIGLRREWPELRDGRLDAVRTEVDEAAGRLIMHRGALTTVLNLGESAELELAGTVLWASDPDVRTHSGRLRLPPRSAAVVKGAGL
jgi:malto-oligosyltrehalose trehalohydrolase